MLRPIDNWYLQQQEPAQSCLHFMRGHLLQFHPGITEAWKYGMPFFCYNAKMFCYLWVHKQFKQPYIGIVEGHRLHHPELLQEKRARMKIFLIDPVKKIPVKKIDAILKEALSFYGVNGQ